MLLVLSVRTGGTSLADPEAFELISQAWLRAGWDTDVYGFSWMGRPIIQLPEDMMRIQELIYELQPDVIVETGVAHGGSLIFYAGLCTAMGKGRVIGIDIEIRPHNREAIETHRLSPMITLVEGSSVASDVVAQVKAQIVLPKLCLSCLTVITAETMCWLNSKPMDLWSVLVVISSL